jgi:low temperature requirement protein LtrA
MTGIPLLTPERPIYFHEMSPIAPSVAPVPAAPPSAEERVAGAPRVTTLELFFDLVFVFIVTQITKVVAHSHTTTDFLRAFLVLAVTWWMYGGYAWLTNNIDIGGTATRLHLLAAMAAFFVMALAIPGVAGADGAAFAVSYFMVILIHATLFTRAPNASARAIFAVAPFNFASALFVLAAAFVPGRGNLLLWSMGLLSLLAATLARAERGFSLRADHFAERHGLIILIALGESVVGIGTSAGTQPVGLPLVGAAVLSLALAAALWWCYFDRDDIRGEHAMARADGPRRARLGVLAYWLAHLIMIAGIVVVAAGIENVIASLPGRAEAPVAWFLAVGVACFLTGEAAFRGILELAPGRLRFVTAALALATAPLGALVGGPLHLGVLVALLGAMLWAERVADNARPEDRVPAPR